MTLALGVIADDYTGASDLANALATNGLRVVQTIGVPPDSLALPDVDAVVVALKSRSIAADEAVRQSLEADRWLRGRGATHVLFKVCSTFDSTDAGNIGPVSDALRDAAGGGITLVNPGFPGTGRRVFQGHLFVHDQPLNESPLRDHPLNPMHDANLVRVLARQSRAPVGLVPLQVVEQGADAVRAALGRLSEEGRAAAIVDAVNDAQFEVLGQVALDRPISTGASGLGIGLARALRRLDIVTEHGAENGAEATGRFSAIIAGSCSKATLEQIAVAERSMPVLHLDVENLLAGKDEAAAALSWAGDRLRDGPVLIASSRTPDEVQALQKAHGGASIGEAIESALADVAAGLVDAGVGRLVVAGGETSGAVVNRLGLQAFLIGAEIAPGVPALRVIGRAHAGLGIALKSGNFGGPDFFGHALDMLG
ncbi:MAG: four-carbon acid sugar kinase family protein [Proteobacteria bacterium]|nr:four-carbon acid sugar kinase family protein [Pseudomonadota bacterium]